MVKIHISQYPHPPPYYMAHSDTATEMKSLWISLLSIFAYKISAMHTIMIQAYWYRSINKNFKQEKYYGKTQNNAVQNKGDKQNLKLWLKWNRNVKQASDTYTQKMARHSESEICYQF